MPDRPAFDDIKECAKAINEHITAMGIKGQRMQAREATVFAIGFAKALSVVYPGITLPIVSWIQFKLAFRCMAAIKEALNGKRQ